MILPVWTRLAQADLAAIDDRYAPIMPEHADRTGRAAIAAGHFLAQYPAAGPVIDDEARKWRVKSPDYVLIYRILGEGVEILRVRHVREDWR